MTLSALQKKAPVVCKGDRWAPLVPFHPLLAPAPQLSEGKNKLLEKGVEGIEEMEDNDMLFVEPYLNTKKTGSTPLAQDTSCRGMHRRVGAETSIRRHCKLPKTKQCLLGQTAKMSPRTDRKQVH